MARRSKRITITEHGRDHGKSFVITELPADAAEWWATRALLALTNAGADLPAGVSSSTGMAGMAAAGVQALAQLRADVVKPLMDEMFACVQYEHSPDNPLQPIYAGEASQIEEVATRIRLREEILELHLGFSLRGAALTSASASPQSSQAA